jgi:hypothetical protein
VLPGPGTPERERIDEEALALAEELLRRERGQIPHALYLLYMHFRDRFIEERGLVRADHDDARWREALQDAATVADGVMSRWTEAILAKSEEPRPALEAGPPRYQAALPKEVFERVGGRLRHFWDSDINRG